MLDPQAQERAIIYRLIGAPLETLQPLHAFDEPWRTIYLRITRARARADAEALIWRAVEGLEDGHDLAASLIAMLPGEDAFSPYPSLHEMSARFPPVDWLWPSWIPCGLLTLFGAAPGAGRSPAAPSTVPAKPSRMPSSTLATALAIPTNAGPSPLPTNLWSKLGILYIIWSTCPDSGTVAQ